MTITPKKTEVNNLMQPKKENQFDWKNCWYPITFVRDFSSDRPYGFTLYDEPFVLFRDKKRELACLKDICPHRAAKLSDGQIMDGKIECLYHGWQFDTEGKCQQIPQLPDEVKIPNSACVNSFLVVEKQGMIWFWRGEASKANQEDIPTLPNLDRPEFVQSDKVSELPYNQSYFIENVLDPAHVHISHNGSQGKREKAQPLEMEVIKTSVTGFQGRFRDTKSPNKFWSNFDFVAPNLVLFYFTIESKKWSFGLALYSLPLGHNKCRVLTRSYRNFVTWKIKITPRWMFHLGQNRILEEDLQLVRGQAKQIKSSSQSLKELWSPLKTSDLFVLEYRKWLDRNGSGLPYYQGYTTLKLEENHPNSQTRIIYSEKKDRFYQHTQFCRDCNRAYQTTIRLKQMLIVIAIALAAIAIVTDVSQLKITAVMSSILSVIMAVIANQVKTKFERSYSRY